MADATRQRTIYQIQQILKAYKAKLEKASTYRDFLSAEGKSLTDDYMEKNSETKSLIEKAVSEPSFFLNMENDNLIRYSDVCIKLNKLLKLKVQDVERIKKIVNTNFFITSDAQRITSFAEVELGRIVTYNVGEAERIDANNILNKGLYDVEWEVEDVGGNFDEATAKKEKRIFKLVNTMKNAATDWPIISLISDANPFEIQLKAVKLGEYKIRAKIYNDTGLTKTLYDVIEFEQFVNDVDEKIASLSTFEKLKKALEMVKWKREIDIGALAKSLWNSIPMILFIAALIISCGEIASAILILMSLADGCRNINDGFTKVAQGFETVKNAGSENALRHGGELIYEGLMVFGLGTIEVFLSKCTMKNVHTARIQLLKGETKAIAQSGTKALPSAATKEIASSTSTAVPALTEIQISETMAESAKKTSLVLADVPVKSEEKKLLDEVVKDGERDFKEIRRTLAENENKWFTDNVKPDYIPPYKPGTSVKEIALTRKTTFVRVYDKMPNGSGMYGSWLMKLESIEELTPLEIRDKFALPNVPIYICDVELDMGIHLREGEVNPINGWGKGGGIQYDLMGQRVGEFKNERLLEDK